VYAVSLENGTITWSAEMDGRVDSAVAVADGQVVAVARNTDTAQVVVAAFDESTGERSWPAQAIQANSTAGTAPSAGGGSLFIGSADRRVRALDSENGTELLTTLATYIAVDGSPARTAEQLHIHVSTAKQRLARIGDILQVDIRSYTSISRLAIAIEWHSFLQGGI